MKTAKRKIKSQSVNTVTGEIHETIVTQIEIIVKRPINGYQGTYMKRLREMVDLSKSAQRLLFNIIDNVDDYNKICAKWNQMSDEDASNTSKAKKELLEADFIAEIGKSYVLNPFVVLPRYQTKAPEEQYRVQQMYNRYVYDMNDWYDGIDDDVKDLYGYVKR